MKHKIHKLKIIKPCKSKVTPCGFDVINDSYYNGIECKHMKTGHKPLSRTSKDWKKVTCKNCLKSKRSKK